jgi:hypothetical protein
VAPWGGLLVTVVGRLIVREWNTRLYLELVAEAVAVGVAAVRRPPGRARPARPVLTDGPAPRPPAPMPAARGPERYRTLTPMPRPAPGPEIPP